MFSLKVSILFLSALSLIESTSGAVSRSGNLRPGRQLKKSSKKGGNAAFAGDGGFAGGYFYDRNGGFISGPQLDEPPNKPCIPFDDARKWITEEYPSDSECRVEAGAMTSTAACCRVYPFTDLNGPQKWLKYDSKNEYANLRVSEQCLIQVCRK